MKVLALVGEQVSAAFSLAGMETLSPSNHQELLEVFDNAIYQKDLALLVISARYAIALKKEIEAVRLSKNTVIILEISSSKGDFNAGDKLMQHIKKAIGQ
mgnify:CR=1 FL=1